MTIKDFFHGYGEINVKDQFVSSRLVSDALSQNFKIAVVEETPHYLKCKIKRFARLYAIPVLFPNPTIEISWKNNGEYVQLNYWLTCFDYYYVGVIPFLAIMAVVTSESTLVDSLKIGIGFGFAALVFFGSLVLMDTKILTHRIKRTLMAMNKNV